MHSKLCTASDQRDPVRPCMPTEEWIYDAAPTQSMHVCARCPRRTRQGRVAAAATMLVAASAPAPASSVGRIGAPAPAAAAIGAVPEARASAAAAAAGDVHLPPQRAEARSDGHVHAPAKPCT